MSVASPVAVELGKGVEAGLRSYGGRRPLLSPSVPARLPTCPLPRFPQLSCSELRVPSLLSFVSLSFTCRDFSGVVQSSLKAACEFDRKTMDPGVVMAAIA